MFLYRFDPHRFRRMLLAYRGEAPDVREVIAGDFGARWVFVTRLPKNEPFRKLLRADPDIRLRYADNYTEVYEVL